MKVFIGSTSKESGMTVPVTTIDENRGERE
jgi:hypothetical protein